MKIYDFTKERWQEMLLNCPEFNFKEGEINDNKPNEKICWQNWFHVKPWATDSLFNKADYAAIRRKGFEVVR